MPKAVKVHSQLDTNSYLNKQNVLNLNVKKGQSRDFVKLTTDRVVLKSNVCTIINLKTNLN
jgi:hypothetical protein